MPQTMTSLTFRSAFQKAYGLKVIASGSQQFRIRFCERRAWRSGVAKMDAIKASAYQKNML